MFLLTILYFIGVCASQDLPSLRLVNLLYRHGDRSPVESYPTNPITENDWPQGYGQLTKEGMREHYQLGQFYREYYKTFLNASYDRFQISVRSSNLDRCLLSAECHLAGLYPPTDTFLPNVTWQPVPIHTVPEKNDSVLALQAPCPAYDKAYDDILHSDIVKEEEKRNKDFYIFVGEKTGLGHENISNIWPVADTLYCESRHNFSLPSWVNSSIINKLRTLESFSFTLMYNTTLLQRLKGGPLLKVMLENMNNKINRINGTLDAERARMYMYSAHDTTVAALLSALGVFNDISPPYAASVILELHEDPANTYYVKVFYNNGSQPMLLTVPGLLMFGILVGGFVIITVLFVIIAIKCTRKSPRTKYSLVAQEDIN
ncbi:lysosomal acid phosphatase-like isoform X2 [Liolophura sinensis]|uniref:lysosomal acid phosphatase-like isoform X2 n=1 Tax=Liolophura sinensis TaxID=3198878 RepID=UPI0031589294